MHLFSLLLSIFCVLYVNHYSFSALKYPLLGFEKVQIMLTRSILLDKSSTSSLGGIVIAL